MRDVNNVESYLAAVIREFREECEAGFSDEYACKRAVWKAAVIIWEVAPVPDTWLDDLRSAALGEMKASRIQSVIASARKKAASHE